MNNPCSTSKCKTCDKCYNPERDCTFHKEVNCQYINSTLCDMTTCIMLKKYLAFIGLIHE